MRWLAVTVSLLDAAGCENTNRNSPLTSSPDLRIADAAMSSGLPQTAIEVTRAILQADPRNTGALMRQGDALASMGSLDAAEECYQRVLAIDPHSVDGLRGLGRIYLAMGQTHDAETTFRKAASLAAEGAEPLRRNGFKLELLRRSVLRVLTEAVA